MHSLASAARILAASGTVEQLPPLLSELGFAGPLAPLTRHARKAIDLPCALTDVRVSRGRGSLRVLAFAAEAGAIRSSIQLAAARLSARAPQLLWLIVCVNRGDGELGIAAFDSSRPRPRVAALVTQLQAIVDSDCETVCALAATRGASDILVHCRWLEILGRESVSRKFFRVLERAVGDLASSLTPHRPAADSANLALLYVSRLLFLSFLETKGWLDGDHAFLANRFADCMMSGGAFHRRVLNPLFFGTLNTRRDMRSARAREFGRVPFLNGGLFGRSPREKRSSASHFTDEALGDVFGDLLSRYRFTAREDATAWSEAAIDPEMLGKAFESLMSARDRKNSGAFYTPQPLVRVVTRAALVEALASRGIERALVDAIFSGSAPPPRLKSGLLDALTGLRVLDPACGSGAFLVHVLEELSVLAVVLGDARPVHTIRRALLTHSIYGVDVNPTAVWLCELRLWLAMSIEDPETDPMRVTPLPNLDRNIRVGDSLSGEGFHASLTLRSGGRLAKLRARYTRATGPRKRAIAAMLDAVERDCAVSAATGRLASAQHGRRELISMARSPDLFGTKHRPDPRTASLLESLKRDAAMARCELRRLRDGGALPFSFSGGFGDVAARGGFDVIVANPPWVRTHNLGATERKALRDRFSVYRESAWAGGSEASAAGRGFASQVDAAALFVERSTELLRPGGAMSLVLPAKLWWSLAGGGVRALLLERTRLKQLHDLTNAPQVFEASVYPSLVVALARDGTHDSDHRGDCTGITCHSTEGEQEWSLPARALPLDSSRGSPWLLVPPAVRNAFDTITRSGIPLHSSLLGRPQMGVKTGCNDAFLVGDARACESAMLRPVVRGDCIEKWKVGAPREWIIWTHDSRGPLENLPPDAGRHLLRWRRILEQRSDARRTKRWWTLFRTESADAALARVVWADIGKTPRAAVLRPGDISVPLNSCYVVQCPDEADAWALAALLNSPVAAAWLRIVAEPARGGYRRYMGWTMGIFPLPADWPLARSILAPIGELAHCGSPPSDADLRDAVLSSYGLSARALAPLLEWSQ